MPLIELARRFAEREGSVDERVDSLILRGRFGDEEEQRRWLEFCDNSPAPFISVQVYDTEIMGDLDASEAFSPDKILTLTIVKPTATRTAAFIFAAGVSRYLEDRVIAARILCAELESRAAFQANGVEVIPWQPDVPI